MDPQIPWPKLAKYMSGECSPDEKREVEEWIGDDPSRKALVKQLRRIWDAAGAPPTDNSEDWLDVEAEWEELRDEMGASSPPSPSSADSAPDEQAVRARAEPARSEREVRNGPRRAFPRSSLPRGGIVAATVLLLVLGGVMLWRAGFFGESVQESMYREAVTERGERATLRLSDGTKVKLNASSTLRFPRLFSDRNRRVVHLSGEAYFDVRSDPEHPFIVKARDASVNVHGTAFNVRARPGREDVQVAVEEGGVSLQTQEVGTTEKEEVKLSSGEVGRVVGGSMLVTIDQADLETHIGWTEGRLVFENTSLPEVAARLGRWYNLEFVIQDASLRSLRLTANLKSQSPTEVLNVITASLGIRYRIDQDTVFLTPKESSQ